MDQRGALVFSRLPSPHRLDAAPIPPVTTVEAARHLVGLRDRRPPLAIALAISTGLTGRTVEARDEVELIAWAQAREAWKPVTAIAPGDLLVFDRAVENRPASLVAVALGRDGRGVVEIVYAARGVVRRGFVDPARPKVVRDRERRAVNTYLRHGADQPPAGTRYLAGELFAGVIGPR